MLPLTNLSPNLFMKTSPCRVAVAAAILLFAPSMIAQEEEQSEGLSSLLNTLKDSVKDLDVGEGMKDLPKQLSQLKKNYAEQTAAMEQMKAQIELLKKEMVLLKKEVALLKGESPEEVKLEPISEE